MKQMLLFLLIIVVLPVQGMEPPSLESFVVSGPPSLEGYDVPGPIASDTLKYAREFGFGITEEIAPFIEPADCAKWDKNWADLVADIAVQCEEVAHLKYEYVIHGRWDPHYETLLAISAGSGDEIFCRLLIAAGADPNDNPPSATTPLIEAAKIGHESLCKFLLDAGANINARGKKNFTALFEAIVRGRVGLCKLLIDAGAKVNEHIGEETPVHLALTECSDNNETIIKMLLQAGANVSNFYRRPALIVAAEQKNESLCTLFVDVNEGIKTVLGCLRRLKNEHNLVGHVLYTHRNVLLLPYLNLEQYVPTKKLLSKRDKSIEGYRAYDYLPIDRLNPLFGARFSYDPSDKEVDALVEYVCSNDKEKEFCKGVAKGAQADSPLDHCGLKPKGRDFFILFLPVVVQESSNDMLAKLVSELMVHRQQRVNNETFTGFLCINRLRKNNMGGAELLYLRFKKLMFPHLYQEFSYVPLMKLLNELPNGKAFLRGVELVSQGKK